MNNELNNKKQQISRTAKAVGLSTGLGVPEIYSPNEFIRITTIEKQIWLLNPFGCVFDEILDAIQKKASYKELEQIAKKEQAILGSGKFTILREDFEKYFDYKESLRGSILP